jgi:type VI secretion system secreted protein VgrG
MSIEYKQSPRHIAVATSLGDDVLLLASLHGAETISRPFEYELELLSTKADISAKDLVGKSMTARVDHAHNASRYFNGIVASFAFDGYHERLARYRAKLVPWFWLLLHTADCRIFQDKAADAIIREIFNDFGFKDFDFRTAGSPPQREYCVQYRETAFDFVSRLMEEEGWYYYFEHANNKHTMVIIDGPSRHKAYPNYESIDFRPGEMSELVHEHVSSFHSTYQFRSGSYAVSDYNFKTPKTDLTVSTSNPQSYANSNLAVFDFPGQYDQRSTGENIAKRRLQELHAGLEIVRGETTARGVAVGCKFKLAEHPRKDLNKEYLVLSTTCSAVSDAYESSSQARGESYQCSFTAIPYSQAFRPRRTTPKPVIAGAQTAVVVGPSGEEIHVDEHARVKLMFHWDRRASGDDKSSCWVRVAQTWAGKQWGSIFTPRVGQEVVVEFLEGDPDRPLITGRVYNAENKPPYDLPGNKTRSTLKTLSTKGGGGFNELRFEDKKGSEQIFIHAEKQMDRRVKKDDLTWIGENQHLIVTKDQFNHVKGDQHSEVGGDLNEKVGTDVSLKAGMNINTKAGMNIATEAGMAIHIKAGMTCVIEAGASLTIKVGGSYVNISPAGVAITGPMVLINSGGAAGAGSGCSPTPPVAPKEADKDEAGKKSDAPEKRTPPVPAKYSPAAAVLQAASRDGTPFCEVCARAAAGDSSTSTSTSTSSA